MTAYNEDQSWLKIENKSIYHIETLNKKVVK